MSKPDPGSYLDSNTVSPELFTWGVKRAGREADHSPPFNSEVKTEWVYTRTQPVQRHGVNRGQIYFFFFFLNCAPQVPTLHWVHKNLRTSPAPFQRGFHSKSTFEKHPASLFLQVLHKAQLKTRCLSFQCFAEYDLSTYGINGHPSPPFLFPGATTPIGGCILQPSSGL